MNVEHPTSNIQHRMLNKVFCQFINWWSEAISSFDVGRSSFNMFSVPKLALMGIGGQG